MHKSAIFGLFLMASLLLGTSVNMNMFSSANAQGMEQNYNSYEQSTYGNDPYGSSSYDTSYSDDNSYDYNSYDDKSYDDKSYDKQSSYGPQQPSYDKPKYSTQSSYSDYSDYKTKDKKYECRTGPFEGFFVSSVEFCDNKKFDDKRDHKDRDNKTGQQGPPGPQGPQGPQGIPGVNGTNGINGTNGVNGTDFDPCVACLLDALVKLDSGAILVNVTLSFTKEDLSNVPIRGLQNITLPLVIDVDVALLLQQQLAVDLGLDANATIFEICAAIDAQGLDVEAVIASLEVDLEPIVRAQLTLLITQIIEALHIQIPPEFIQFIIDHIDIDAIVAQIIANVEVSLGILQDCLGLPPTTPTPGEAGLVGLQIPTVQQQIPTVQQQIPTVQQMNPTIQQMNPTIQQNSLPSGDPMLQLQSTLSPIS